MDNTAANLNSLNITRLYPASKEKLFEMWTNPALIISWFAPGDLSIIAVEANLRIDGQFRIIMQEPDGNQYIAHGVYKNIVKPDQLAFTWIWSDTDCDSNSSDTLVSIDFKNKIDKTELTLLYSQLGSSDSLDTLDQGWAEYLENLESVL